MTANLRIERIPIYTYIPLADVAAFIAEHGKPYDTKSLDRILEENS